VIEIKVAAFCLLSLCLQSSYESVFVKNWTNSKIYQRQVHQTSPPIDDKQVWFGYTQFTTLHNSHALNYHCSTILKHRVEQR
jgi:hypothetical protein